MNKKKHKEILRATIFFKIRAKKLQLFDNEGALHLFKALFLNQNSLHNKK